MTTGDTLYRCLVIAGAVVLVTTLAWMSLEG